MRRDRLAAVLGDRARVLAALDDAFAWSYRNDSLERSASRMSQLLQSPLPWPESELKDSDEEQTTIAFVEQWIIDVASMTDATVAAVRELKGDDGLRDFIHSMLVVEQRIRLDLAWQQLGFVSMVDATDDIGGPDLEHWGMRRTTTEGSKELTAALSEWQAAVVCLDEVDPITTELVRLRCANYHDCHT